MITLTASAEATLKIMLKEQIEHGVSDTEESNTPDGIRFVATGGGCSGFQYSLGFSNEQPGDIVQDAGGLKVYSDQESKELLDGIVINYVVSLNESGFIFNNPNSKGSCGCGKSFSS